MLNLLLVYVAIESYLSNAHNTERYIYSSRWVSEKNGRKRGGGGGGGGFRLRSNHNRRWQWPMDRDWDGSDWLIQPTPPHQHALDLSHGIIITITIPIPIPTPTPFLSSIQSFRFLNSIQDKIMEQLHSNGITIDHIAECLQQCIIQMCESRINYNVTWWLLILKIYLDDYWFLVNGLSWWRGKLRFESCW